MKLFHIGDYTFDFSKKTYVMGVLNVTPDSFSDGGKYSSLENAINHALEMEKLGASIIDIGGESTRPGSSFVPEEEEIKRVIPVIKSLKGKINTPLSIDTYKAKVAEKALQEGALLVNDISGLRKDEDMARVVANYSACVCIMHSVDRKSSNDIFGDVYRDLEESVNLAIRSGIKEDKIIIDVGIGFFKTPEQNIELIRNIDKFADLGYPNLLGVSKKSFMGKLLGFELDDRKETTLAISVFAALKNVQIVRVHDVLENVKALKMIDFITKQG